jgi:hypothetical protein
MAPENLCISDRIRSLYGIFPHWAACAVHIGFKDKKNRASSRWPCIMLVHSGIANFPRPPEETQGAIVASCRPSSSSFCKLIYPLFLYCKTRFMRHAGFRQNNCLAVSAGLRVDYPLSALEKYA